MIECGGVWLPDREQHLVQWMTRMNQRRDGILTYQMQKRDRALSLTDKRGIAVDVGAHCGLWSMWLGREFDTVLAFEPVPDHVECLRKNCAYLSGINVFEYALGEQSGHTQMHWFPADTGDTYPEPGATDGDTQVMRYDDQQMPGPVDFLKLDCEGFELFALKGMQQMLERDHPAIVVEQKPSKARKYGLHDTDAVTWLKGLGAKQRDEIAGDFFLSW